MTNIFSVFTWYNGQPDSKVVRRLSCRPAGRGLDIVFELEKKDDFIDLDSQVGPVKIW